jgi:hypothetical protein
LHLQAVEWKFESSRLNERSIKATKDLAKGCVLDLFRQFIRTVALFLARSAGIIAITLAVVCNIGAIRRARVILLMSQGGFGFAIAGPDWLRRLHLEENHLTFFGAYRDARYNRSLTELWGRHRFIWVQKGISLPAIGAVYDPGWDLILFRIVQRCLQWWRPDVPCYGTVDELIAATPAPPWLDIKIPFYNRVESRYYPLIQARPRPALHVSTATRRRVAEVLKNSHGSDFNRRCAFFIRHRADLSPDDTSSVNRLAAPMEAYLPAICVLNRAGYQVLLPGDQLAPAGMKAELPGGIVDWDIAGLDRDSFRLFAGTEVDLHIGCLSGGSSYLYVTDIPGLMLNAFAPGDALPRTTVYYKWLFEADGQPVGLNDLLGGRFYDHQLHGCRLVNNSAEEMAEAVEDFVLHCGERPYGVDPRELGIEAPWLRAANGRLSPVWLRRYYSQVGTAQCNVFRA